MLLNEVGIFVPMKIRHLLDKYELGLLYLAEDKYTFLSQIWGTHYKSYATAMVGDNIILLNTDRIKRDKLLQPDVNYILLHEVAHAGRRHLTEKKAHKCALGLARYHKIKIDAGAVLIMD